MQHDTGSIILPAHWDVSQSDEWLCQTLWARGALCWDQSYDPHHKKNTGALWLCGGRASCSHLNLARWWSRAGLQSVSTCEKAVLSMFISHPSAAQHNLQPPTVDLTQPLFPPPPASAATATATTAATRSSGFSGQLLKMKIRVGGGSIGQRRRGLFLPPVIPLMLTIKWGHHPDTWGIS